VDKLHLDTEIIEPFVELADRRDGVTSDSAHGTSLALDLEEECLIK
jgi:hypothetical protein